MGPAHRPRKAPTSAGLKRIAYWDAVLIVEAHEAYRAVIATCVAPGRLPILTIAAHLGATTAPIGWKKASSVSGAWSESRAGAGRSCG
jgi:hypothetical protein